MIWAKRGHFRKRHTVFRKQKRAASLFSREQGLGAPTHIKMQFVIIDVDSYALFVLGGSVKVPLLLIPSWAL